MKTNPVPSAVLRLLVFGVSMVAVAACTPVDETPVTPPEDAPAELVYLDQSWTPELRRLAYHTPQGSQMVPYDWFLALERPAGGGDFAAFEHLAGFGFLEGADDPGLNPDGLPVGFAREPGAPGAPGAEGERAFLGLTCAACHTGQVEYQGQRIRIDGGPSLADMTGFFAALDRAMASTDADDARFERFASRVLGDGVDEATRAALRTELGSFREAMPDVPPPAGHGRQDAFAAILNEVTGTALGQPGNFGPSDAPVSFPFLWDTPQLAWVQWNGLAANPIERNIGEVLGVFGHINLAVPSVEEGLFDSTVRLRNLWDLERWIDDLSAPAWPEEILGEIDDERAARGEVIYQGRCEMCHALPPYPMTDPADNLHGRQYIRVTMVPVEEIGTDPKVIQNLVGRTANPGNLKPLLGGRDQVRSIEILIAATSGAFRRLAAEEGLTAQEIQEITNFRNLDPREVPPNLLAYKARPLAGIWATAPYLHNGSVPNLYEMLLPAAERSESFWVGSRQLDPERVGFDTAESDGASLFDTSLPGNRNVGHEMANDLSEEERLDLLEFLKTL